MPDLNEALRQRLGRLHDGDVAPAPDALVETDLHRGRVARRTRRRRRGVTLGAGALVAVALGSLGYALADPSSTSPPAQASRLPAPSSAARSTTRPDPSGPSAAPAVRLVAYHGRQQQGFTVRYVPQGYVLQGVSDASLDVARADDHSPLSTFVGKIVVTLDDHASTGGGSPVEVNGHPGTVSHDDGTAILTYSDGSHNLDVQAWADIHLTRSQLVAFAEGITVTGSAVVSHG